MNTNTQADFSQWLTAARMCARQALPTWTRDEIERAFNFADSAWRERWLNSEEPKDAVYEEMSYWEA